MEFIFEYYVIIFYNFNQNETRLTNMPKPYFENIDKIHEIIRVNHAGEFGAQVIYQGQLKFTKNLKNKIIIKEMLEQELAHLNYFENEIKNTKSRPTFLLPIWNICGYMLGVVSGVLGIKTAMVVTESIEEVIVQHYQQQIDYLNAHDKDNSLLPKIIQFQQDEAEHIHTAIQNESHSSLFYKPLAKLVKGICYTAITLSKKI